MCSLSNVFCKVLWQLNGLATLYHTISDIPSGRDSENDFCHFSFLGYLIRNDFVPSRTQKNDQEWHSFSVGSDNTHLTRNDYYPTLFRISTISALTQG